MDAHSASDKRVGSDFNVGNALFWAEIAKGLFQQNRPKAASLPEYRGSRRQEECCGDCEGNLWRLNGFRLEPAGAWRQPLLRRSQKHLCLRLAQATGGSIWTICQVGSPLPGRTFSRQNRSHMWQCCSYGAVLGQSNRRLCCTPFFRPCLQMQIILILF